MKIVAAGFITAILIFVVASAMSEILWKADDPQVGESSPRRKSNNIKSATEEIRSSRSPSRSKRANSNLDVAEDSRTSELQSQLSEVRQRESDVQAKQDALRIVYDEIREEQQSVDQLRRKVSDEIALLRDTATRLAEQERRFSAERPAITTATSSAKPVESAATTRPLISMRDVQTVRDTAVLVNRLAQQGSVRAATSLLRRLKDRDAARVLAELDATDSEMALRLTQDLQATRNDSSNRR